MVTMKSGDMEQIIEDSLLESTGGGTDKGNP
jgi:hypothetical protein